MIDDVKAVAPGACVERWCDHRRLAQSLLQRTVNLRLSGAADMADGQIFRAEMEPFHQHPNEGVRRATRPRGKESLAF